ncbi:MAG: sodium/glutamate symporter [Planctomycetota bacterium]|nr:sodium/glutamate symporter [Planctomycetota bacterium]
MREIVIEPVYVLIIAITVLWLGAYLVRNIAFLGKYNIPTSVAGGIVCSVVVAVVYYTASVKLEFDLAARDMLLLAFFSTIGLSARFRMLLEGGKLLVLLLVAAVVFLVLQDVVGILVALSFGADPAYGLMAGSISFAGGHGTSITWGSVAQEQGLEGATALGLACATIGLIAGGVVGGPIARDLINRNRLRGDIETEAHTTSPQNTESVGPVSLDGVLDALWLLAMCIGLGHVGHGWLEEAGVTLPAFLPCMFVGIVLTNLMDVLRIKTSVSSIGLCSDISLQLFLAMSLMSMQLWTLASAIGPIAVVLVAQVLLMATFARFVIFRLAGGSYDAAVITAGFVGLGLGATPVGIANMRAVTSKFGASPTAFLVVPLIGAFFLDIANALIIQGFISLPFFK